MLNPIRPAAGIVAAALLWACSAHVTRVTGDAARGPLALVPLHAADAPAVANAPVPAAGRPGAIALDPRGRAELERTVAAVAGAERPRLRYALAAGDDGRRHVIVYDGEGLPADGRRPGKPHAYIVFKVLNASGAHYDPQQNALVAPIPPPPQRSSDIAQ